MCPDCRCRPWQRGTWLTFMFDPIDLNLSAVSGPIYIPLPGVLIFYCNVKHEITNMWLGPLGNSDPWTPSWSCSMISLAQSNPLSPMRHFISKGFWKPFQPYEVGGKCESEVEEDILSSQGCDCKQMGRTPSESYRERASWMRLVRCIS